MLSELISVSQKAGQIVSLIYQQSEVRSIRKCDNTVITLADIKSHHFIYNQLKKLFPFIPIISEESSDEYQYEQRKHWSSFFLIDPLDGTKEFIRKNNEFTINIALIKNNTPMMGVIHAPALNLTYYAEKGKGAYKIFSSRTIKLMPTKNISNKIRVVISRSHFCNQTQSFLNKFANGKELTVSSVGSALKFGLVAENSADIYPRLSPTMEWDTAAGEIIVQEAGKQMLRIDDLLPLQYNKAELVNAGFIVQ